MFSTSVRLEKVFFNRRIGMSKFAGIAIIMVLSSLMLGTVDKASAADANTEAVAAPVRDGDGPAYRNITDLDKFVAALEDGYTPQRYAAVMDRARFSPVIQAGLKDGETGLPLR